MIPKDIIFILNLILEVCAYSDEQLSLQGLQIDVIVTRTNHRVGCRDSVQFTFVSLKCRQIARKSKQLGFDNLIFFKKLKFGIVDLTELDSKLVDGYCLPLSLAFAKLCENQNHNVIDTLQIIFNDYQTKELVLWAESILGFSPVTGDFFSSIELYSKLLGRSIFVMCINKDGAMEIFYKTDIHNAVPNYLPIYLLYTEPKEDEITNRMSHCSYIFEVNLNSQIKFCKICQRKVSPKKIKSHTCLILRCKGCLNYYSRRGSNYSINGQAACLSKLVDNFYKKCNLCGRLFTNKSCYETHCKLTALACKTYRHCTKCKRMFLNQTGHIHYCYEKWCFKCCSYHQQNQLQCYVKPIEKVTTKRGKYKELVFTLHLSWTENMCPVVCLSSQIDVENVLSNCYTKTAFNQDILVINDLNDFNFNCINDCVKGTYTFDYVVEPLLQFMYRKFELNKLVFIVGNATFEFICKNMTVINASFQYVAESPCTIKINNRITIKKLSSYYDNSVNNLALEIESINCASTLMPYRIAKCTQLDLNKSHNLDKHEFPIEDVFGSSIKDYKQLLKERDNLDQVYSNTNKDRVLHFRIVAQQHAVLFQTVIKLELVFKKLLTDVVSLGNKDAITGNEMENKKPSLFSYTSTTKAVFSMFLMVLPKNSLPILSSHIKSDTKLIGVSKAEILVCKFFSNIHTKMCKTDKIMSYVTGDRSQFTTFNNLSCDFYCSSCRLAIFVQGLFKSTCKYHPNLKRNQFYGNNLLEMQYKSKIKIKRFKKLAGKKVSRILEIFECCVYCTDNWSDGKNSIALELKKYDGYSDLDYLQSTFKSLTKSYSLEDNLPLDYQLSIQSQIVESMKLICNSDDQQCDIRRFDLSSAYIRCLESPNLQLPMSCNLNILHGSNGQTFVDESIINAPAHNLPFCVIRARVFTNKVNDVSKYLPYFSYTNTKGKSSLTLCKMCSNDMIAQVCLHTPYEQSFIVNCLSEDLRYAYDLGYYFNILEVHYWPNKGHYNGLSSIASLFLKYKQTSDMFTSKIVKKMGLSAIGRWAMNYKDFGTWKKIENFVHLMHFNKNKVLKMYDVYSENTCYGLVKLRESDNQKKNHRNNVSPIVLSAICSTVKRRIHSDCLKVKLSNTLSLIRIDADCITIKLSFNQNADDECNDIFLCTRDNLFYKKEPNFIRRLFSYKRRSYSIEYDKYAVIKSCGFSATLDTRFRKIDFQDRYSTFIDLIQTNPAKLIVDHMRIHNAMICAKTGNIICASIPFGFTFLGVK